MPGGTFRLPASGPVTGLPRQRFTGFLPSLFYRFHSYKKTAQEFTAAYELLNTAFKDSVLH